MTLVFHEQQLQQHEMSYPLRECGQQPSMN